MNICGASSCSAALAVNFTARKEGGKSARVCGCSAASSSAESFTSASEEGDKIALLADLWFADPPELSN